MGSPPVSTEESRRSETGGVRLVSVLRTTRLPEVLTRDETNMKFVVGTLHKRPARRTETDGIASRPFV